MVKELVEKVLKEAFKWDDEIVIVESGYKSFHIEEISKSYISGAVAATVANVANALHLNWYVNIRTTDEGKEQVYIVVGY